MQKITFFIAIILSVLFTGCSKENADNEVLVITPEELTALAGKNWNTVAGRFKNKKDYLYSELNTPTTLAAISMPAVDKQAPALNYKLVFNLDKDNKISIVHLDCTDVLEVEKGNKLMLYYYNRVFSKLDDAYYKGASDGSAQPRIPVEALLIKLNNLNAQTASFDYSTTQLLASAIYFASNGSFAFDVRPF